MSELIGPTPTTNSEVQLTPVGDPEACKTPIITTPLEPNLRSKLLVWRRIASILNYGEVISGESSD